MAQRHAIEIALDLARMPALARSAVESPIPPQIIEVMRIAAAASQECQEAAAATGEPVPVLIEAARFYLQHQLFHADADCYRVLGLQPGASRATARNHMRWLLEWLHPDRNRDLESVYAKRVVKAWREVSVSEEFPVADHARVANTLGGRTSSPFRLPWIKQPIKLRASGMRKVTRALIAWVLPTGFVIALLLWSAIYYFGPDHMAGLTSGAIEFHRAD